MPSPAESRAGNATTEAFLTAPSAPHDFDIDNRPKTAPSSNQSQSNVSTPTSPSFDVPRIAIFKDAFSLQSLRQRVGVRKSPTLSELKSSDSVKRPRAQQRVASSPSVNSQPSKSLEYTTEPPLEGKPPAARRPPASWSSNGITTAFGPPPALITRGSFNSELARRAQSPAAAARAQHTHKPYIPKSPSNDFSITRNDSLLDSPAQEKTACSTSSPLLPKSLNPEYLPSLDAIMDPISSSSRTNGYLDDGASGHTDSHSRDGPSGGETEESGRSGEDLFLNLAEDGTVDSRAYATQSRLERRLSRGRRPMQRQSLPASSEYSTRPRRDSSSHDSGYATRSAVLSIEAPVKDQRRASAQSSLGFNNMPSRNPAAISTDQRFNAYRNRYVASASNTTPSSRRPSMPESSQGRTYRPSKLNNFSTRDFDSPSITGSPLDQRQPSVADGGESVVSNSAQSTVWDELHELKSRIHKMEVNDVGGTVSNGSAERPRTATTTVTTMSSSPKYPFKSGLSPAESLIGGPGAANMHPLLHQSLARCKKILNPVLYRALELAASDALELVILASNGSSQGTMYTSASIVNGMVADRQLRRKADNVCRNLTDLCIALCEGKLDIPPTTTQTQTNGVRRDSRDLTSSSAGNHETLNRNYSRHASLEPESMEHSRVTPSRALHRIEARRASLRSGGGTGNNSPRESESRLTSNAVPTTPPQVIAKLPRTGTSLLRTRRRAAAEEGDDEEDRSVRPISRAATEVGSTPKRSHRVSGGFASKVAAREYTSQHPLPGSSPLTQTAPTRRLNGTLLKADSPRSPSTTSSLHREGSRKYVNSERATDSDATQEDDTTVRRANRRSLGLYTSGTRTSLGLGKRDSLSGKGRSVVASGD